MTLQKSDNMRYSKNGKEIELFSLSDKDLNSAFYRDFINSNEYRAFMHATQTDDLYAMRMKRIEYLKSYYGVKVLGVRIDGKFVGQSCAFKSVAIIQGVKTVWWWGIDMYLFAECRGLGIGRSLQEVLHKELPNFSSAWYTPINGIIKRKCGAHAIFDIWFNYYPVSSAITVFGDLCFRKLFKCPLPLRLSIPRLYSRLNGLFVNTKLNGYRVSEILYEQLNNNVASFMEEVLRCHDFHIERSEHFLKWRYKMLKAGYHMLQFEKEGKICAILSFSHIYDTGFDEVPIQCVTIYDHVISPDAGLSLKQLLLYVVDWYKKRGENFDGFQMLEKITYIGRLCYPLHSCQVLSTNNNLFAKAYITLADQDMDQI